MKHGNERGIGRVAAFLLAAVAVALLAGTGWVVWSEIDALHDQVAELSRDVRAAEERARQAEARAAMADDAAEEARRDALASRERADVAEEAARQSALERMRAEAAQAAAEMNGERALDEANRARDEAASARDEAATARQDADSARRELDDLRRRRQAELDRLQEALNQIVDTRRTAIGMVMNLGSDRVEFDFDRAELRPANRELLSRIAGVLLTARDYRIQIFGHTDEIGTDDYNQELSERRAAAVASYLVEAGLDPSIMSVQGLGETKPLVAGTDPDSRQRNRRVEIGIIDTMVEYRSEAPGLSDGRATKKKIKR